MPIELSYLVNAGEIWLSGKIKAPEVMQRDWALLAYCFLRQEQPGCGTGEMARPASLLLGRSFGGAAVIAAAVRSPGFTGVATIAATAGAPYLLCPFELAAFDPPCAVEGGREERQCKERRRNQHAHELRIIISCVK